MCEARVGNQAVVTGPGIAGLSAAGARDELPDDASPRPGAPQGRHLHGLLGGGQRALDELFPGFEEELVRATSG